jgi:signal peptidase I
VLDEEINTEYIAVPGTAAVNILLEENEYFVLGDNRNESVDSRSADVGNIVRDDIIGKALFRLNNFSIVSSLNKKSE